MNHTHPLCSFHYSIYLLLQHKKDLHHVVDVGVKAKYFIDFWETIFDKVTGFEPAPEYFNKLKPYFGDSIYPYMIGLVDGESEFNLNLKDNSYSGTSFRKIKDYEITRRFSKDDWETITVEQRRLDTVLCNEENISLIKSDTECNDLDIINGGLEIIEKHRPLLQIEHVPYKHELSEFIEEFSYKQIVIDVFPNQYYLVPNEWDII